MIQEAFEEFLQYQVSENSPATVKIYRQICGDFCLWLHQNRRVTISPAAVDQYITALREGWQPPDRKVNHRRARGPATLAKYRRSIRAFVSFAAERGHWNEMKIRVRVPPARPQPMLLERDVDTLLASCKRDRERLIISLLVVTGIRAQEALDLDWSDVNLDTGEVVIRKGKGSKTRKVFLNENVIDLFRASMNGGGLVLDGLRYQGLRKFLDRMERRTSIKCNAHALRRTFATISTRNGMSPFVLQRLMGHSSIETTMNYVRLIDDDLKIATSQYGPLSQN